MATNLISLAETRARQVISSPELGRLLGISLGTVNHPGMKTRRYLSGGSTLTESERETAIRLLAQVTAVAIGAPGPETTEARLALIAKMLMVYPVANASAESGQARLEAYYDTLSEIAPWAIDRAIRKWHNGECGHGYNYQFAPAPATLLEACRLVLWQYTNAMKRLEALLSATTLERAMDPKPIQSADVQSIVPKIQRM
jgi:hypothetical protein